MLKKEAREITGGLSKPSKMPGPAHNLPAVACKTGAKLVKVFRQRLRWLLCPEGSIQIPQCTAALNRRLQALEDPRWVGSHGSADQGEKWFQVA